MKKLFLISITITIANLLAFNALAAGSLYQRGNNTIGLGYSSLTPSVAGTTTMSGISMQTEHLFTDHLGVAVKIDMLSGTVAGTNTSLNPITVQAQWHGAFTDNIGYFAGLGYATTYGSVGLAATRDTGITYEAGFEYKFPNNIITVLSYKNIGLINGNLSGFNLGVNYSF